MRRIIFLTLALLCSRAMAQDTRWQHKTYADKYYYMDSVKRLLGNFGQVGADKFLEAIENAPDNKNDAELSGIINLVRYRKSLSGKGEQPGVLNKLQELALFAKDHRLLYLESDAINAIGDYYGDFQKYAQAFENYRSAYNIYTHFTPDEFPPKRNYLYTLGIAYLQYGDNDNALRFLNEAENTKADHSDEYANAILNALGLCFRKMSKYDTAEWYYKKIYDNAVKANDTQWVGIAVGNIGICYYYQKRYPEAIPLLQQDVKMSIANTQLKSAVGSMCILADIYYHQKEYEKSGELLKQAIQLAESRPFWPDYKLGDQLFTLSAKIYAGQNDTRKAYLYADSALTIKDSLMSRFNAVGLSKAEEKVQFVQRQLEQEQLANQKKIELFVRNALIAGIFLLSVIGILFINRQRLKRKKLEADKKSAETELDAATRLLDGFRQSIHEKNNIIERFTSEIAKLKQGEEEETDNELLSKLEHAIILTDQQWDDFRELFEKVHKGFFTKLKRKIPDLTQAEVRFLALTKLKLSSKEMAAMLGISTNAIRIYRHRLRRKLDLDKEDMIEVLVENL